MTERLPPGIWDNPQSDEQRAYEEFVRSWTASGIPGIGGKVFAPTVSGGIIVGGGLDRVGDHLSTVGHSKDYANLGAWAAANERDLTNSRKVDPPLVRGGQSLTIIEQEVLVLEILERTERRSLLWSNTSPTFVAKNLPYEYFLTRNEVGTNLDVRKDGMFFGTYSSIVLPVVNDLYNHVESDLYDFDHNVKEVLSIIGEKDLESCRDKKYNP